MFESLFVWGASLLSRKLNIGLTHLHIDRIEWIAGTFHFSNVSLSGAAFAGLKLPFTVRRIELGEIKLHVPVWNLMEEACSLRIEHVLIVLDAASYARLPDAIAAVCAEGDVEYSNGVPVSVSNTTSSTAVVLRNLEADIFAITRSFATSAGLASMLKAQVDAGFESDDITGDAVTETEPNTDEQQHESSTTETSPSSPTASQTPSPPSDPSVIRRLLNIIVGNVSIALKDVHVRFEDRLSAQPYALNVHLKLVEVTPVNHQSEQQAFHPFQVIQYRTCVADGLFVGFGSLKSASVQVNDNPLLSPALRRFPTQISASDSTVKLTDSPVETSSFTCFPAPRPALKTWSVAPTLGQLPPLLRLHDLAIEVCVVAAPRHFLSKSEFVDQFGLTSADKQADFRIKATLDRIHISFSELQREHLMDCLCHFNTYFQAASFSSLRPRSFLDDRAFVHQLTSKNIPAESTAMVVPTKARMMWHFARSACAKARQQHRPWISLFHLSEMRYRRRLYMSLFERFLIDATDLNVWERKLLNKLDTELPDFLVAAFRFQVMRNLASELLINRVSAFSRLRLHFLAWSQFSLQWYSTMIASMSSSGHQPITHSNTKPTFSANALRLLQRGGRVFGAFRSAMVGLPRFVRTSLKILITARITGVPGKLVFPAEIVDSKSKSTTAEVVDSSSAHPVFEISFELRKFKVSLLPSIAPDYVNLPGQSRRTSIVDDTSHTPFNRSAKRMSTLTRRKQLTEDDDLRPSEPRNRNTIAASAAANEKSIRSYLWDEEEAEKHLPTALLTLELQGFNVTAAKLSQSTFSSTSSSAVPQSQPLPSNEESSSSSSPRAAESVSSEEKSTTLIVPGPMHISASIQSVSLNTPCISSAAISSWLVAPLDQTVNSGGGLPPLNCSNVELIKQGQPSEHHLNLLTVNVRATPTQLNDGSVVNVSRVHVSMISLTFTLGSSLLQRLIKFGTTEFWKHSAVPSTKYLLPPPLDPVVIALNRLESYHSSQLERAIRNRSFIDLMVDANGFSVVLKSDCVGTIPAIAVSTGRILVTQRLLPTATTVLPMTEHDGEAEDTSASHRRKSTFQRQNRVSADRLAAFRSANDLDSLSDVISDIDDAELDEGAGELRLPTGLNRTDLYSVANIKVQALAIEVVHDNDEEPEIQPETPFYYETATREGRPVSVLDSAFIDVQLRTSLVSNCPSLTPTIVHVNALSPLRVHVSIDVIDTCMGIIRQISSSSDSTMVVKTENFEYPTSLFAKAPSLPSSVKQWLNTWCSMSLSVQLPLLQLLLTRKDPKDLIASLSIFDINLLMQLFPASKWIAADVACLSVLNYLRPKFESDDKHTDEKPTESRQAEFEHEFDPFDHSGDYFNRPNSVKLTDAHEHVDPEPVLRIGHLQTVLSLASRHRPYVARAQTGVFVKSSQILDIELDSDNLAQLLDFVRLEFQPFLRTTFRSSPPVESSSPPAIVVEEDEESSEQELNESDADFLPSEGLYVDPDASFSSANSPFRLRRKSGNRVSMLRKICGQHDALTVVDVQLCAIRLHFLTRLHPDLAASLGDKMTTPPSPTTHSGSIGFLLLTAVSVSMISTPSRGMQLPVMADDIFLCETSPYRSRKYSQVISSRSFPAICTDPENLIDDSQPSVLSHSLDTSNVESATSELMTLCGWQRVESVRTTDSFEKPLLPYWIPPQHSPFSTQNSDDVDAAPAASVASLVFAMTSDRTCNLVSTDSWSDWSIIPNTVDDEFIGLHQLAASNAHLSQTLLSAFSVDNSITELQIRPWSPEDWGLANQEDFWTWTMRATNANYRTESTRKQVTIVDPKFKSRSRTNKSYVFANEISDRDAFSVSSSLTSSTYHWFFDSSSHALSLEQSATVCFGIERLLQHYEAAAPSTAQSAEFEAWSAEPLRASAFVKNPECSDHHYVQRPSMLVLTHRLDITYFTRFLQDQLLLWFQGHFVKSLGSLMQGGSQPVPNPPVSPFAQLETALESLGLMMIEVSDTRILLPENADSSTCALARIDQLVFPMRLADVKSLIQRSQWRDQVRAAGLLHGIYADQDDVLPFPHQCIPWGLRAYAGAQEQWHFEEQMDYAAATHSGESGINSAFAPETFESVDIVSPSAAKIELDYLVSSSAAKVQKRPSLTDSGSTIKSGNSPDSIILNAHTRELRERQFDRAFEETKRGTFRFAKPGSAFHVDDDDSNPATGSSAQSYVDTSSRMWRVFHGLDRGLETKFGVDSSGTKSALPSGFFSSDRKSVSFENESASNSSHTTLVESLPASKSRLGAADMNIWFKELRIDVFDIDLLRHDREVAVERGEVFNFDQWRTRLLSDFTHSLSPALLHMSSMCVSLYMQSPMTIAVTTPGALEVDMNAHQYAFILALSFGNLAQGSQLKLWPDLEMPRSTPKLTVDEPLRVPHHPFLILPSVASMAIVVEMKQLDARFYRGSTYRFESKLCSITSEPVCVNLSFASDGMNLDVSCRKLEFVDERLSLESEYRTILGSKHTNTSELQMIFGMHKNVSRGMTINVDLDHPSIFMLELELIWGVLEIFVGSPKPAPPVHDAPVNDIVPIDMSSKALEKPSIVKDSKPVPVAPASPGMVIRVQLRSAVMWLMEKLLDRHSDALRLLLPVFRVDLRMRPRIGMRITTVGRLEIDQAYANPRPDQPSHLGPFRFDETDLFFSYAAHALPELEIRERTLRWCKNQSLPFEQVQPADMKVLDMAVQMGPDSRVSLSGDIVCVLGCVASFFQNLWGSKPVDPAKVVVASKPSWTDMLIHAFLPKLSVCLIDQSLGRDFSLLRLDLNKISFSINVVDFVQEIRALIDPIQLQFFNYKRQDWMPLIESFSLKAALKKGFRPVFLPAPTSPAGFDVLVQTDRSININVIPMAVEHTVRLISQLKFSSDNSKAVTLSYRTRRAQSSSFIIRNMTGGAITFGLGTKEPTELLPNRASRPLYPPASVSQPRVSIKFEDGTLCQNIQLTEGFITKHAIKKGNDIICSVECIKFLTVLTVHSTLRIDNNCQLNLEIAVRLSSDLKALQMDAFAFTQYRGIGSSLKAINSNLTSFEARSTPNTPMARTGRSRSLVDNLPIVRAETLQTLEGSEPQVFLLPAHSELYLPFFVPEMVQFYIRPPALAKQIETIVHSVEGAIEPVVHAASREALSPLGRRPTLMRRTSIATSATSSSSGTASSNAVPSPNSSDDYFYKFSDPIALQNLLISESKSTTVQMQPKVSSWTNKGRGSPANFCFVELSVMEQRSAFKILSLHPPLTMHNMLFSRLELRMGNNLLDSDELKHRPPPIVSLERGKSASSYHVCKSEALTEAMIHFQVRLPDIDFDRDDRVTNSALDVFENNVPIVKSLSRKNTLRVLDPFQGGSRRVKLPDMESRGWSDPVEVFDQKFHDSFSLKREKTSELDDQIELQVFNFLAVYRDIRNINVFDVVFSANLWIVNYTSVDLHVRNSNLSEDSYIVLPALRGSSPSNAQAVSASDFGFTANDSVERLFFQHQLMVRVPGGRNIHGESTPDGVWSNTVPIGLPGSSENLNVRVQTAEYQFSTSVTAAPPNRPNTRILSIIPKFVMVNRLSQTLYLRQDGSDLVFKLEAGSERADWVWPDVTQPHLLRLSFEDFFDAWSGRIPIGALESFQIQIPGRRDEKSWTSINAKLQNSVLFVVFQDGDIRLPALRVRNDTSNLLRVFQSNTHKQLELLPYSSQPFCWEEPTLNRLVSFLVNDQVVESGDSLPEFMFNSLVPETELRLANSNTDRAFWDSVYSEFGLTANKKRDLYVTVVNSGPTVEMCVSFRSTTVRPTRSIFAPIDAAEQFSATEKDALKIKLETHLIERRLAIVQKAMDQQEEEVLALETKHGQLPEWRVFVTVVSARNLKSMDFGDSANPVTFVRVGTEEQRTDVIRKSVEPVWNQTLVFEIKPPVSKSDEQLFAETRVRVSLMHDRLIGFEFMGRSDEINLEAIANEEPREYMLKLESRDQVEVCQGMIKVSVQLVKTFATLVARRRRELHSFLELKSQERHFLNDEKSLLASKMLQIGHQVVNQPVVVKTKSTTSRLATHRPIGAAVETHIHRGKFMIVLYRAEGLPAADENGLSDPFVNFHWGSQKPYSSVVEKTLFPKWNETFTFDYDTEINQGLDAVLNHGIYISVWDKDAISDDDYMGEMQLDPRIFATLPVGEQYTSWYSLHHNARASRASKNILGSQVSESTIRDLQFAADSSTKSGSKQPNGWNSVVGDSGRILIGFEWKELELRYEQHSFRIRADLPGLGLSLIQNRELDPIRRQPQLGELIFVSLSSIKLDYSVKPGETKVWASIDNMQIDNQSKSVVYPIFLSTSKHPNLMPLPLLQLSCLKDTNYSVKEQHGDKNEKDLLSDQQNVALVDFYQYASVLIQEIHINVELDIVLDIWDVVQEIRTALSSSDDDVRALLSDTDHQAIPATQAQGSLVAAKSMLVPQASLVVKNREAEFQDLSPPPVSPLFSLPVDSDSDRALLGDVCPVVYQDTSFSRPAFFGFLEMSPIKIVVTLRSSKSKGRSDTDSSTASMLRELLAVDLDNVSLMLNALIMENMLDDPSELTAKIWQHYKQNLIAQAPQIVGSVGALGNPTVLLSSIGSGVKDFFYEPALGIVQSPAAFGKGLAKGSLSLVKNSMYGLFNAAHKATSAAAGSLAALSMDDDFIKRTKYTTTASGVDAVSESLVHGAKSLGLGFVMGISGIIVQPMRGWKADGFVGFLSGILKGLVGFAAKPTAGILQFISSTAAGIRNITTQFDDLNATIYRVRFPRPFLLGLFEEYNHMEARAQFIVHSVRSRAFLAEYYRWHLMTSPNTMLICTHQHIVAVKRESPDSSKGSSVPDWLQSWKFLWCISYPNFFRLQLDQSNLTFYERDVKGRGNRAGALHKRDVPFDAAMSVSIQDLEREITAFKDSYLRHRKAFALMALESSKHLKSSTEVPAVEEDESSVAYSLAMSQWTDAQDLLTLEQGRHHWTVSKEQLEAAAKEHAEKDCRLFVHVESASRLESTASEFYCICKLLECSPDRSIQLPLTSDAVYSDLEISPTIQPKQHETVKTTVVRRQRATVKWDATFQMSVPNIPNDRSLKLELTVFAKSIFNETLIGTISVTLDKHELDVKKEFSEFITRAVESRHSSETVRETGSIRFNYSLSNEELRRRQQLITEATEALQKIDSKIDALNGLDSAVKVNDTMRQESSNLISAAEKKRQRKLSELTAELLRMEQQHANFRGDFESGEVKVTVLSATGLNPRPSKFDPAAFFFSASEEPVSFVEVKSDNQELRTEAVGPTSSPDWNQTLQMTIKRRKQSAFENAIQKYTADDADADDVQSEFGEHADVKAEEQTIVLILKVWDTNHFPKTFLGSVPLTLSQLFDFDGGGDKVLALQPRPHKKQSDRHVKGRLMFQIEIVDSKLPELNQQIEYLRAEITKVRGLSTESFYADADLQSTRPDSSGKNAAEEDSDTESNTVQENQSDSGIAAVAATEPFHSSNDENASEHGGQTDPDENADPVDPAEAEQFDDVSSISSSSSDSDRAESSEHQNDRTQKFILPAPVEQGTIIDEFVDANSRPHSPVLASQALPVAAATSTSSSEAIKVGLPPLSLAPILKKSNVSVASIPAKSDNAGQLFARRMSRSSTNEHPSVAFEVPKPAVKSAADVAELAELRRQVSEFKSKFETAQKSQSSAEQQLRGVQNELDGCRTELNRAQTRSRALAASLAQRTAAAASNQSGKEVSDLRVKLNEALSRCSKAESERDAALDKVKQQAVVSSNNSSTGSNPAEHSAPSSDSNETPQFASRFSMASRTLFSSNMMGKPPIRPPTMDESRSLRARLDASTNMRNELEMQLSNARARERILERDLNLARATNKNAAERLSRLAELEAQVQNGSEAKVRFDVPNADNVLAENKKLQARIAELESTLKSNNERHRQEVVLLEATLNEVVLMLTAEQHKASTLLQSVMETLQEEPQINAQDDSNRWWADDDDYDVPDGQSACGSVFDYGTQTPISKSRSSPHLRQSRLKHTPQMRSADTLPLHSPAGSGNVNLNPVTPVADNGKLEASSTTVSVAAESDPQQFRPLQISMSAQSVALSDTFSEISTVSAPPQLLESNLLSIRIISPKP